MPVNVTMPLPALRAAMPIHQFGTASSLPPRGPPCRLSSAKTMPSCMNCQPPVAAWAGSACVPVAPCATTPAVSAKNAVMENRAESAA